MTTTNKEKSQKKSQKEKMILLKVLVFSFAALIFFAWIFTLQSRLKNIEDLTLSPKDDEFVEIKNNLDQVVEGLNSKIKDDKNALGQKDEENQANIEEGLDSGVPENEIPVEPSIPVQPTINNCPEYINCMPTVGGPARSCAIPPGCENITQVVW